MIYAISENVFKKNFNWKSVEEKGLDSLRITHAQDQRFKLFPYKATGEKAAPAILDTKEIIAEFVKSVLNVKTSKVDFSELWKEVLENVDIDPRDEKNLQHIIKSQFYYDGEFFADNIGLYAYQGTAPNKSIPRLAEFLSDVLSVDENDSDAILKAMDDYPYNALEYLVISCLKKVVTSKDKSNYKYYKIFDDSSKKFKKDFHFMLSNGMTSPEDIADLLSLYYFYYTSQTCVSLDHFGNGERTNPIPMYFALDWEKVSSNRNCCKGGWKKLQENIGHIFSHAITLELINQTESDNEMFDYIKLNDYVQSGRLDDSATAKEIRKIEKLYTDAVGDYHKFDSISENHSITMTDTAIRHLFDCVNAQCQDTHRKRATDSYVKKMTDFYRNRWLKNRRKAGLVLNLTERDIIFLTKISIQENDRIRLVDLFKKYEDRGVYLDNTSKRLLQDFLSKLNLLDKKSDSGDAQYVKRIL